jgi:hypothetical protein
MAAARIILAAAQHRALPHGRAEDHARLSEDRQTRLSFWPFRYYRSSYALLDTSADGLTELRPGYDHGCVGTHDNLSRPLKLALMCVRANRIERTFSRLR